MRWDWGENGLRQADPAGLKSDDILDEPLLERLKVLKSFSDKQQVKRDLIKFYIYSNKAKLYSDDMSNKITQVNRLLDYDMPGRLQISTMVGIYMSGRLPKIHPDDKTITKLSDMYDQITTKYSGKVDYDTVKESSDNYDHRQQLRGKRSRGSDGDDDSMDGDSMSKTPNTRMGGGSSNRKKKHPRSTNKQKLLAKRVRRRSMKNKKKGKWYKK